VTRLDNLAKGILIGGTVITAVGWSTI